MAEAIEIAVARLEECFSGVQKILEELARDQKTLTGAYRDLVTQNQRVTQLEETHAKLTEKLEEHIATTQKTAFTVVVEVFKLALAALLGSIGMHLTTK
jgi:septal ring factor EnvC (AmiA/AmiB activator)